jgi:hypothetical protein
MERPRDRGIEVHEEELAEGIRVVGRERRRVRLDERMQLEFRRR